MVTKHVRGGWVALDVLPAAVRQTRMSVASLETQIARNKDSVAPLTLGSAVSSLKASYTCRSLTPPPRSRKLAGFPPCRSMMSHVAMAKPAPFTGRREHQHDDDVKRGRNSPELINGKDKQAIRNICGPLD